MSKKDTKIDITDRSLDFQTTKEIVRHCIDRKEPIMIWGPPGIGKSDMIFEIGRETGREVIDIRLPLYENVDIKGYPKIDENTGKLVFAHSAEFPSDPKSTAILFLDEINSADPSTQKASYQLILNRRIGQYILPEGVAIVAAGNRQQDKGITFAMPKPLENRFVHVEVRPNFEQWMNWAVSSGLNSDIISFLSKFKERFYDFDPSVNQRSFATPRTWTKASKLIANVKDDKMVREVIAGCVGAGAATEFMAYRSTLSKLPDVDLVLSGKIKTLEESLEMSLSYALVINCLYALRERYQIHTKNGGKDDEFMDQMEVFFKFLLVNEKHIGPEFVAMCVRMAKITYNLPLRSNSKSLMEWIKKNAALFNEIVSK